jgi:endonuclease/exonuclease/phosphatase (EEP) superfamily protein YafD
MLPRGSLLSGFEYIPTLWLYFVSSIIAGLLFVIQLRRTALIYISVFFLFIVFLGDYSMSLIKSQSSDINQNEFVELDVMAYNVQYFSSGEKKILEFLNQSVMDIYLLTESVLTDERKDQIKEYLPDYKIISDGGKDVTILSRYPVSSYNIVKLPTFSASLSGGNDIHVLSKNGDYRSFIHAVVDVKGMPVHILSIRLIAGRPKDNSLKENLIWGGYLLKAQKTEIDIIINYIHSLNGPVIIGGDLNTNPSSSLVRRIREVVDDAYFSDHIFGDFTFRTSFPLSRLDYLFHSRDVITKNSEVGDSYLSDHFPVIAKFLIPKKRS